MSNHNRLDEEDSPAVFFLHYDDKTTSNAYSEPTIFLCDTPACGEFEYNANTTLWERIQHDDEDDDIDGIARPPRALTLTEEHWTVLELRAKLESILSTAQHPITALHLNCDEAWKTLSTSIWTKFCQVIRELLPDSINTLEVDTPNLRDEQWVDLFRHLPSHTMTKLTINEIGQEDLPNMFRQIGDSFPNLLELVLMGNSDEQQFDYEYDEGDGSQYVLLDDLNGSGLGYSLQKLPKLQKLVLYDFCTRNPYSFWQPIVAAIRGHSNLKLVQCQGGFYHEPGTPGLKEYDLDEEQQTALQFGPRLNKAKKLLLLDNTKKNSTDCTDEDLTLERWVDALISVRDRVDCLDYFLSTTDPNLYAWNAIGKPQPPKPSL